MGRSYAGILGLLAFAVTVTRAIALGQGPDTALWNAWLALWIFAAVGWVLGTLAQATVDESATRQFNAEMARQQEAAAKTSAAA